MGTVQSVEERGNGSVRMQIDGDWYTAWPPLANKAKNFQAGSTVTFTFDSKESNGRVFKNLKSISSGGDSPVTEPAKNKSSYVPKDPMEKNLMMMVRYAIDCMPERPAKSPQEAVDLVWAMSNSMEEKFKQAKAGRSQSQSS